MNPNDPQPTFSLPPCPACSNAISLERPFWRYAHNVSHRDGRNTYTLTGCKHAGEVFDPAKFTADPEVWALVEDSWGEHVARLFAVKTEGWKPNAVESFRRALSDKAFLPGAVAELQLSPAHPAQQEPNERHENGSS